MEMLLQIWPVLAFLTVQTVAITWWAATTTQRVYRLEEDMRARQALGLGERMATIEAHMQTISRAMEEIKDVIVQKGRR